MKKVLWDQFDITSSLPATPNPVKAALLPCPVVTDSQDTEFLSTSLPEISVLAAAVVVAALTVFVVHDDSERTHYTSTSTLRLSSVPVYLRLGQLVYYS